MHMLKCLYKHIHAYIFALVVFMWASAHIFFVAAYLYWACLHCCGIEVRARAALHMLTRVYVCVCMWECMLAEGFRKCYFNVTYLSRLPFACILLYFCERVFVAKHINVPSFVRVCCSIIRRTCAHFSYNLSRDLPYSCLYRHRI